jgi:hypothetical protein
LACLVEDYCDVRLGMLQISSTTRNLVPRFKWGNKGNFGRTDLCKVVYMVNNSGNVAEVSSRVENLGKHREQNMKVPQEVSNEWAFDRHLNEV